MDVLQNHFYLIKIALFTLQIPYFSLCCHKQKMGLKIVIMRNIIISPEQVVVVEVKTEVVVVFGQGLVMV